MVRILMCLFVMLVPSIAAELSGVSVPSETGGTFSVPRLTVNGKGQAKGLKLHWEGSAINDTRRDWHKVTFCVRAFDGEGNDLTPPEGCILRLWIYEWKSGSPASWKGSQKVRVGEGGNQQVEIASVELSVEEMLTDPESVETFTQTCKTAWPLALQEFIDEKFRPTMSDTDSFVASFEYEGGDTVAYLGTVNNTIKAYTSNSTGFFSNWKRFRVESASLMLKPQPDKGCRAEIKMSFAGFNKSWYELTSNHQFEKRILKAVSAQLGKDYRSDLDQAISELPTEQPEPTQATGNVSVAITSDPTPADIEIDGEYVGSTSSTLSLRSGSHVISIKKRGFEPWERQLTFRAGEERTIHAELVQTP